MINNPEVLDILQIVGLNPRKVPAKVPEDALAHIQILVRYAGYKAGVQAAARWHTNYDLTKKSCEILGDFIEDQLTFRDHGPRDFSLFHDMNRTLALLEGATGYDLTSREPSLMAYHVFWSAIIDDIKNSLKSPPLVPEGMEDEPLEQNQEVRVAPAF